MSSVGSLIRSPPMAEWSEFALVCVSDEQHAAGSFGNAEEGAGNGNGRARFTLRRAFVMRLTFDDFGHLPKCYFDGRPPQSRLWVLLTMPLLSVAG